MNKKMEILAPAGSMESLVAALRSGANAVYIGGKSFSARSSASNFENEEIAEAAKLCHLYGAKLYLAVNTVITDNEAALFCKFIADTAKIGIDAYIVQDTGCALLIKKVVPDAALHASTQMTVHTLNGAEFLKRLGFTRVVPARELSMAELSKIAESGLEIEAFVHGALCMSVSGQCYMSALIGSRSANRGGCAQACRLPFSACGNKDYCALSLKDLSLLSHTDELEKAGVCSLKIEGRMKRPEYVASAVQAVNDALNGKTPDMNMLRSIFSRDGFTDGYFTAKMQNMFGTRQKSDITSGKDILPVIRQTYNKERKIYGLSYKAIIKENCRAYLSASADGVVAEVYGDIPQTAINRPIDNAYLEKQLSKLGDTVFEFEKLEADIDNGLMLPASSLNEMRRNAVEKLQTLIIEKNTPVYSVTDFIPKLNSSYRKNNNKLSLYVSCTTLKQAEIADEYSDMLILPLDICFECDNIDRRKIIAEPPRFISDEAMIISELKKLKENGISHLLCVNYAYIETGKNLGFTLHGGFGLNICNSYSIEAAEKIGLSDITLSFELTLSQINRLDFKLPSGSIIYGRLPLMLLRNCPVRNEIGCKKCTSQLTDRTGHSFPVRCHNKEYVEILNSDILYMSDKYNELSKLDFGVILLDDENDAEIRQLLGDLSSQSYHIPDKKTRGLFYRGIE